MPLLSAGIEKLLLASVLVSVVGIIEMATGLLIWNSSSGPNRWVILLARVVILTFVIYLVLTARIAVEVFLNMVRGV